jgi:hypothetical protein
MLSSETVSGEVSGSSALVGVGSSRIPSASLPYSLPFDLASLL